MRILALDTSTEACSVAIIDQTQPYESFIMADQKHSDLLLTMLDTLLKERQLNLADFDAIAFGRGPGSFTGLRIAAGVAQGLAFGQNLPLIPISTLQSLSLHAPKSFSGAVITVLDARMHELYWAAYCLEDEKITPFHPENVSKAEALQNFIAKLTMPWLGIGPGWPAYQKALGLDALADNVQIEWPHAAHIAQLAQKALAAGTICESELALPVYLRDNVAVKKS